MTIIESKDLSGVDIITIINEENNTAESMTKAEYERRLEAAKEAQSL